MKTTRTLIAAALFASVAAGASAAYMNGTFATDLGSRSAAYQHKQDEGTPRNLIAGFTQDEGVPRNLIAGFTQDEGVPRDLIAGFTQDEGVPRDMIG